MRQRITERTLSRKAEGEIWDEYLPGFGLRIGARKRTFFVMGRVNGKQVRRTVGNAATMTLADARTRARDMLDSFARGVDPEEAERLAKLEAARSRRNTFAAVAADYMDEHGSRLKSAEELQRKLTVDILPVLGELPIASIRRADVKGLIKGKAAASPVAANRVLALVRAVFNYAIDEELIEANPAARLKPNSEKPRERTLSRKEIKTFWWGLERTRTAPRLQQALRLMLATGQRRGEVLGATWSEFDLDSGWWEIPSGRTKADRAHRVPLSPLAVEILGPAGDADAAVFANGGGAAFSPYSASQAVRRELKALGLANAPATPHDLRRTMASQLGELGVSRFIISKLLNHAEAGVTGRVYDKHDYAEQKRLAMLAWGDRLQEIVTGKEAPSNVAKLERTMG